LVLIECPAFFSAPAGMATDFNGDLGIPFAPRAR
jgi:hypothetical protein